MVVSFWEEGLRESLLVNPLLCLLCYFRTSIGEFANVNKIVNLIF